MATLLIYAYKNVPITSAGNDLILEIFIILWYYKSFFCVVGQKKNPPPVVITITIDELYPVPLDKLDYCATEPISNTIKSENTQS